MPAPNEITVSQLNRLIGTPDCPVVVDICIPEDVAADPYRIPSSIRHDWRDLSGLAQRLTGRRAVICCQKGKKLSHGVAALLASEGIDAQVLHGGMYAWRDDKDTQRIAEAALPESDLWVTRHRPKIDRIACPWLIHRFVTPAARILFVPPAEVQAVADRFNTQPFDIEGVFWSHRGENCTFDTMLDEFTLHSPALDRMAQVIRGADTNRHDLHPAVAGLLALSVGLSKQYRDDQAQLKAGMAVYDALYRWARDGHGESHDWPVNHG